MAIKTRDEFKARWVRRYQPKQSDYVDLFDSFYSVAGTAEGLVKSVNWVTPDASGNVFIDQLEVINDAVTGTNKTWSSRRIRDELLLKQPYNANIQTHIASTDNPHYTTAVQVGLGNVDNESKQTMFHNPVFTGIVYGVNYDMVGAAPTVHTQPVSTITDINTYYYTKVEDDVLHATVGTGITVTTPACTASGLNITCNAVTARLYNNSSFVGYPQTFSVPGTGFTLTDNAINYLVIKYNSGNPQYFVTLNVDDINESDVIPVNTILTSNGYCHMSHWDLEADGLPNKLHRRFVKTQRYARESGLSIAVSGSTVTIGSGVVWRGARSFSLQDTHSDGTNSSYWFLYYLSGSTWYTTYPAPGFNYTQYNNAGSLTNLTGNRCNINWVFRGVEDHQHGYYVLSDKWYKDLPTAQAEKTIPALPAHITNHAILVGRIICQNGVPTPVAVEGTFDVQFQSAHINDHTLLTNIGINTHDQIDTFINNYNVTTINGHYVSAGTVTITSQNVSAAPLVHGMNHVGTGSDPITTNFWHGVVSRTTVAPLPTHVTSTTFTLSCSATPLQYYYKGTLVTVSVDKTVSIPASGKYFIYFTDTSGTPSIGAAFPDQYNNVLVASVVWDSATSFGVVNDERHNHTRDIDWHLSTHQGIGTRYISGLNFTFSGNTNANTTFAVSAGQINDEDIKFTIANQTKCRIWRETSSNYWSVVASASTLPYYYTTGIVATNGSTWATVPPVTSSNQYFNYWIYATTDVDYPIYSLVETVAVGNVGGYATVAAARAISPPNIIGSNISAEIKFLYRIIVNGAGLIQTMTTADDYRSGGSIPGGGTLTYSHNALSNLDLAAVGVAYGHINDTTQTIAGDKTFTGLTTFASSGAIVIPSGTDADRPSPARGMIRYNTTGSTFEGYNGSTWGAIGGSSSASGGSGLTASIVSSSITASKNYRYICNAATGSFNVTLPASASPGDFLIVQDAGSTWNTNAITILRNGNKLNNIADDLICNLDNVQVELTYISASFGWQVNVVGGLSSTSSLNSSTQTTSFTAVRNTRYICNTVSGGFNATLPVAPTVGDYIEFQDSGTTWATANLTILRNGLKINGLSEDFVCDVNNAKLEFTYVSTSFGWAVTVTGQTLTLPSSTTSIDGVSYFLSLI